MKVDLKEMKAKADRECKAAYDEAFVKLDTSRLVKAIEASNKIDKHILNEEAHVRAREISKITVDPNSAVNITAEKTRQVYLRYLREKTGKTLTEILNGNS